MFFICFFICFSFFYRFFIFHRFLFSYLRVFSFAFFLFFFCLRVFSFFFLYFLVTFLFIFFLKKGSLQSDRSKVTRTTVGRDINQSFGVCKVHLTISKVAITIWIYFHRNDDTQRKIILYKHKTEYRLKKSIEKDEEKYLKLRCKKK